VCISSASGTSSCTSRPDSAAFKSGPRSGRSSSMSTASTRPARTTATRTCSWSVSASTSTRPPVVATCLVRPSGTWCKLPARQAVCAVLHHARVRAHPGQHRPDQHVPRRLGPAVEACQRLPQRGHRPARTPAPRTCSWSVSEKFCILREPVHIQAKWEDSAAIRSAPNTFYGGNLRHTRPYGVFYRCSG
jgi:hypothetical protein